MLPVFKAAGELVRLTELLPTCGVIEKQLATATNPHEFAEAYLAKWYIDEHEPDVVLGVGVVDAGVALARELMRQLGEHLRASPHEGVKFGMSRHGVQRKMHVELPKFFNRLTTTVLENGAYAIGDAKGVARQRREYNERNGVTYHGQKFVRPKESCKRFDSRRPAHYGKIAFIHNTTY